MALRDKTYLKSKYETGDVPSQSDYHDWLDSIYIFGEDNDTGTGTAGYAEGKLFYSAAKKALSYFNDKEDIEVNIGQEVLFRVPNNSGATIPNGTIVTPVAGTIVKAERSEKLKSRLVGVTTHDIADGEIGYVTRLGEVGGLDTSMYSINQLLYLGDAGAFATSPPDDGSYAIIIGVVSNVSATEGRIIVDPQVADLTVEVTDTNGFPPDQRTGTTLSVNAGTRTFTIAPTGSKFHLYVEGDKFEFTSAQSVIFSDTEGNIWFYFDKTGLKYIANPSPTQKRDIIIKYCFVSYIYWNAADKEVVYDILEERHGISMSPVTHAYLHITRGTQYASGLSVGNIIADDTGALATHAQFSVESGIFYDEDLDHNVSTVNVGDTIPVAYLLGIGALTRSDEQASFAVLNAPAGRLYYNQNVGGTWQLTEVGNNNFVLYHIFAVNGVSKKIVSVMGQNEYSTVSAARAGASSEITSILSAFTAEEGFPIATIIYQTSTSYTNAVKARIRTTDTGEDYVNWLTTELAQGVAPSDHQNLTNLFIAGPGVIYGHMNEALYDELKNASLIRSQFDSGTADADPGAGKWRYSAAKDFIYMNNVLYQNVAQINGYLSKLNSGAGVYVQNKVEEGRYAVITTTGAVVQATGYVKIPITVDDEGVAFVANDICGFEFLNTGGGGGGASEREIVAATSWDGTSWAVPVNGKQYTRNIDDTVTTLNFSLAFESDAATVSRETIVVVNNSGNSSAISVINFAGGTWKWSTGDPVTGIAAGAIVELSVRNRSNTIVKALTDPEA